MGPFNGLPQSGTYFHVDLQVGTCLLLKISLESAFLLQRTQVDEKK